MDKIAWGIIGCGDVTEMKSGPAFKKVKNSSLVAVMRRDAEKVQDYARRHNVPKWYTDAYKLINDPEINAVYVATPPSSHEEYAIAALQAGKPVYVEKPMTVNQSSAINMMKEAEKTNVKLVVAHYRRAQPLFNRIKQLLDQKAIGNILFARIDLCKKPLTKEELSIPKTAWRVDSAIAGGGLFHDLSPHQLDMMYYFFGDIEKVTGLATNQGGRYAAADIVTGNILFKSGVVFTGTWCFNVHETMEKDTCEIIGSEGTIRFSFFDHEPVVITHYNKTQTLSFDRLEHVQQPMIEKVVEYFLDKGPNPNTAEEGVRVMQMMEEFANTPASQPSGL